MRLLRQLASLLMLWHAVAIGSFRRAMVMVRCRDSRLDRRIPFSEGRAFRRELARTDDLVGRLRAEPRQIG